MHYRERGLGLRASKDFPDLRRLISFELSGVIVVNELIKDALEVPHF